jgi:hypothetical protein
MKLSRAKIASKVAVQHSLKLFEFEGDPNSIKVKGIEKITSAIHLDLDYL